MKENKGQALVEFLLIIPVIVFIILCLIDVGNIVISKNKLEDEMSEVIDLYSANRLSEISNYALLNNFKVTYDKEGDYIIVKISKEVSIMTPGLNNILGKQMTIETKREIYNGQ